VRSIERSKMSVFLRRVRFSAKRMASSDRVIRVASAIGSITRSPRWEALQLHSVGRKVVNAATLW